MASLPTLKEFIDNPMGKGSAVIPNRQWLKEDYNRRYIELKKRKKFDYNVYRLGDEYYIHIIVPSETERENTYDVVLHFTMSDQDFKYDNFLNRYFLKFFSNCPSFTYSFAFAFKKKGLLIEGLDNKYRDEVIGNAPIMRNPGEVISYEKSTMFACLFVTDGLILKNKMYLNQLAIPVDIDALSKVIRTTDTIDMQIRQGDNKLAEKKRKEAELKDKLKSTKARGTIIPTAKKTGHELLKGKAKIIPKKKVKYLKSSIENKDK